MNEDHGIFGLGILGDRQKKNLGTRKRIKVGFVVPDTMTVEELREKLRKADLYKYIDTMSEPY